MKRVLMIAGAALICAGPALAADVTVENRRRSQKSGHRGAGQRQHGGDRIVAPEPPPPPRVEARPEPPRPGMAWQEGYWEWSPQPRTYRWMPGEFAEPPRPAATWTPGHWQQRPDGWV